MTVDKSVSHGMAGLISFEAAKPGYQVKKAEPKSKPLART